MYPFVCGADPATVQYLDVFVRNPLPKKRLRRFYHKWHIATEIDVAYQ